MWFFLPSLVFASPEQPPVAVFVHGMFMTPESWDPWRKAFEARGYETLAPAWPGREGRPAALRADPDPALRDLTLEEVVGVYREAIDGLGDREVVLVGHSMGGLVVQLLLQDGEVEAGVAIDSAPPKGVSTTRWSFVRSNAPVLRPGKAPIEPSLRWFRYAFAHTTPDEEVARIYDEHVVPESRQVGRGPTTRAARIDFDADRPPLLLIAGDEDHIIPASLVDKNARAYRRSPAVTDVEHVEGRTHWTIVGQEETMVPLVADWLEAHR